MAEKTAEPLLVRLRGLGGQHERIEVEVRREVPSQHDDHAGLVGCMPQERGVDGPREVGYVPGDVMQGRPSPGLLSMTFPGDEGGEVALRDGVPVFGVEGSHPAAAFAGVAQPGHPRPEFGHGQRSGLARPGTPPKRLSLPPTGAPTAKGGVWQGDPPAELSGTAMRTTLPEPFEVGEKLVVPGLIVFF